MNHKILKKIELFLWYLFFSIYWTADELGEKDKPQENAKYYLILTIGLNLFAIFEILLFYGFYLNAYLVVSICVIMGVVTVNRIFFKNNIFLKKKPQFSYLKEESYKSQRYRLLILVALWSIFFVAFGALIRIDR